MTSRLSTALVLLIAGAASALADPGHLADNGHGHTHWLGWGILAGLAVAGLFWLAIRAGGPALKRRVKR